MRPLRAVIDQQAAARRRALKACAGEGKGAGIDANATRIELGVLALLAAIAGRS